MGSEKGFIRDEDRDAYAQRQSGFTHGIDELQENLKGIIDGLAKSAQKSVQEEGRATEATTTLWEHRLNYAIDDRTAHDFLLAAVKEYHPEAYEVEFEDGCDEYGSSAYTVDWTRITVRFNPSLTHQGVPAMGTKKGFIRDEDRAVFARRQRGITRGVDEIQENLNEIIDGLAESVQKSVQEEGQAAKATVTLYGHKLGYAIDDHAAHDFLLAAVKEHHAEAHAVKFEVGCNMVDYVEITVTFAPPLT